MSNPLPSVRTGCQVGTYWRTVPLLSAAMETLSLYSTTLALFERTSEASSSPACLSGEIECPEMVYFFGYSAKKEDLLVGASLLDTAASLFFIVTAFAFMYKINKLAKAVDEDVIEISDYTVYVKGLPGNVSDSEEVRCFFEIKFGTVAECTLAKADGRLLKLYFQRGKIKLQLDRLLGRCADQNKEPDKAATRLAETIEDLDAKIAKIRKARNFRCVGAFVTFEREESLVQCLKESPRSWLARKRQKPEHKFRGEFAYEVSQADSPGNVLYENLDVGNKERLVRKIITNTISFGLLLFSFGIIYYLSKLQDEQQDTTLRLRSYSQYYTGTLGYEWDSTEAAANAEAVP